MATYQFDKEGAVYEVDAPDEKSALVKFQALGGLSDKAQSFRLPGATGEPGIVEQTLGGAKHGWDKAALGLKGLVTDLSPEDKALLAGGEQFVKETGPASTVGDIGANIAISGGPTKLLYGAGKKALSFAPAILRKALALAPAAVAGGTTEAVLNPTDRSSAALWGATGGAAGEALGPVLKRVLAQPVKPSLAGKQMMDQGIQPTVRQAGSGAAGALVGGAEELSSNIPVYEHALREDIARMGREAMEKATEEAIPPGTLHLGEPAGRGQFFEDLADGFNRAYRAQLAGKTIGVPHFLKRDVINDSMPFLNRVIPSKRNAFVRDIEAVLPRHTGRMGGETWHDIRSRIRQRIRDFASEDSAEAKDMMRAYQKVEQRLDQMARGPRGFSADDMRALDKLDTQYQKGEILRRAAKYSTEGVEGTDLERLIKAVEAMTPEDKLLTSSGHFMDITQPGKQLLKEEKARLGALRRGGYMATGIGLGLASPISTPAASLLLGSMGLGKLSSSRSGAKYLLGGYDWQKALAKGLRKSGGYGAVVGAPVGAELGDEEE